MHSRGHVTLPSKFIGVKNIISYAESLEQSLATRFGTEVLDVSSEARLHTLFAIQGAHLVEPMLDEVSEENLLFAVRGLYAAHKHERPFWAPDSEDPATARVVFPYAPPVNYFFQAEEKANKQLHMTFGLKRPVTSDGETQSVRVARATIWATLDTQNPYQDSYKLQKNVTQYNEYETVEEANSYLNADDRNANATRTLIGIIANEL